LNTLPHGQPDAGRDAFMNLGCASCHAVEWEADFPDPVSVNPGPELGRMLAMQTSGGVATSILMPSHHVSVTVREQAEDGRSPMGDFTDAMTVRQLIDVVAYLQAQGGETMARARIEEGSLPPHP
jgi:mono/diheme cytochrome c family protein